MSKPARAERPANTLLNKKPGLQQRPGTNQTPARIAPRTMNMSAPRPAGPPADAAASCRFYHKTERLSATDISALASMKNVAKCDTWCELQNPVNHRVFERKLRPKPSWPGHVCLGVTHRVAPSPSGGNGAETGPPCAPGRAAGPNADPAAAGRRDDRWSRPYASRRAPSGHRRPRSTPSETTVATPDQAGLPAEFKHINKRRKRNLQGFP